jgi:hypothetical protein
MQLPRRLAAVIGLIATAGTVAALGAGPAFVAGSDHLDAPTAKHDARIDITDLYAFKSGAGTTLIMNVNPLTSPASSKTARFATNALYQVKIDVTGDAVADIVYRVRFSDTRFASDGAVVQTYTIKRDTQAAARVDAWTGTTIAIGGTTAYGRSPRISPTLGGGRAFAGVRDDPFYFDLPGFVQFKSELLKGTTTLGTPGGGPGTLLGGFTGTDTFAGTNTSAIAIWVPDSRLGGTGRHIGVWATTSYRTATGWDQVDRVGRPAINTVFNGLHVPTSSTLNNAEKEAFNRLRPASDRATTRDNVIAVLGAIDNVLVTNGAAHYTAGQMAGIADTLLPDVLTFQVGNGTGFLNGRKLADDVINAEFGLLTDGAVTSDGVNANDSAFISAFPYLGKAH